MSRARADGLYLWLIGSMCFILSGAFLVTTNHGPVLDFKLVYCSARCLIQHCDPYQQSDVLHIYRAEGEASPLGSDAHIDDHIKFAMRNMYPPSEFVFTLPFAFFSPAVAYGLWIALLAGSFLLASLLMWNLGACYAPIISGGLLFLSLIFGGSLISYGNPGCIAVGLCVVAVWCFLQERFVPAGILCFAASLVLKPHDGGLVWIYFLLAGGVYRTRALQTLGVVTVLCLPMILWVQHLSPHWIQEMHQTLQVLTAHGALNDPGPTPAGGHGSCMITSLQSIISVFWDDPRIYNPISYLICAPLLIAWGIRTVRVRPTQRNAWFALAAIAALSMLPLYHRQYDSKLILLTIPACALLWAEGGPIKWIAFAVNTIGFILTGDLPWAFVISMCLRTHQYTTAASMQKLTAVLDIPLPLTLLVMGVFYLWIYLRNAAVPVLPGKPEGMADAPIPTAAAS